MAALASKINDFLWSVTSDFVPISQQDDFTNGSSPSVPDNRIISVADVQTKLNKISIKKVIGPDNIPNCILRDGACSLAGPVCALFNSSMREGYVPPIWKSANIFPLAKVNPPSILEKHIRPISLTPTLAKMMESFMCSWVTEEVSKSIDPKQYGSVKDSSTVHALVELIHLWQEALDNSGKVLLVLLLDYSKAFDCVDHLLLLTKLANMGVHDCVVKWFTSFLCDRKQRTKIGDDISEWCTINAGALQGTLFGPVGFIVHLNDLRTRLPLYKYVDDSTAWEVGPMFSIGS